MSDELMAGINVFEILTNRASMEASQVRTKKRVSECKFWGGERTHFKTIDQILSYLTWRDSKTAIVYFVDTKEMAAPLKAIEDSTPKHSCFVRLNEKRTAS